ncbi:hypothetical protein C5C99_03515 [Rathayibacter sp. AY1C4]|nr:hypothetical protein C5C99_03515 [Rathayibacter sp. AY1C4]
MRTPAKARRGSSPWRRRAIETPTALATTTSSQESPLSQVADRASRDQRYEITPRMSSSTAIVRKPSPR